MTDSLSWLTTPTKWHIYNTMCIISNCSDREQSPPWLDQLSASMPLKSCKKICSSQLQEGKRQCIGTLVWLTNSWHKEKVQLWVSSTVQVSGLLAVTVLLKLMTFMKRLVVDGPWIGSWIRVFFSFVPTVLPTSILNWQLCVLITEEYIKALLCMLHILKTQWPDRSTDSLPPKLTCVTIPKMTWKHSGNPRTSLLWNAHSLVRLR